MAFSPLALADNCPSTKLTCSAAVVDKDGNEVGVGDASSSFTANPLHCSARVTIMSPTIPGTIYFAVASADGTVGLFTTVNGRVDYSVSSFADGTKTPVVLKNETEQFSCLLK